MTPGGLIIDTGHQSLEQWFDTVAALAEGLVRANMVQLASGGDDVRPRALRYAPHAFVELDGAAIWPTQAARPLLRRGEGNCLDLACYRAAQMRLGGNTRARVELHRRPGGRAHAMIFDRYTLIDPAA